jgi:hypothetical protein
MGAGGDRPFIEFETCVRSGRGLTLRRARKRSFVKGFLKELTVLLQAGLELRIVQARDCQHGLNPGRPTTRAYMKVKNLIVQSVPPLWADELHSVSAREGFFWIRSKFVGGHCRHNNDEWRKMLLAHRVTASQSFDGNVRGKFSPWRLLLMVIKGLGRGHLVLRQHSQPLLINLSTLASQKFQSDPKESLSCRHRMQLICPARRN